MGSSLRLHTQITAALWKRKGFTQGHWAEPSLERALHTRGALETAGCTPGSLAVQRREKFPEPGLLWGLWWWGRFLTREEDLPA